VHGNNDIHPSSSTKVQGSYETLRPTPPEETEISYTRSG
jgi:hypothetical protein